MVLTAKELNDDDKRALNVLQRSSNRVTEAEADGFQLASSAVAV